MGEFWLCNIIQYHGGIVTATSTDFGMYVQYCSSYFLCLLRKDGVNTNHPFCMLICCEDTLYTANHFLSDSLPWMNKESWTSIILYALYVCSPVYE